MVKTVRTLALGLLLSLAVIGVAAPATQAINLETGDARLDRRLRDDEQAITNFDRSLTTYKLLLTPLTGMPDSTKLKSEASRIASLNDIFQAKSFSTAISETFNTKISELKAAGNELVAVIKDTSERDYTESAEVRQAREEVEAAQTKFETISNELEAAAAAYEPPSPLWLIPLIGGGLAVFITILVVLVKKGNSKAAKTLFGDDPAAQNLTPVQRKEVVRLFSDLPLLDKALSSNDANMAKVYQMAAPASLKDDQAISVFGKYGAVLYEYRALLKLSTQDTQGAKADAQQASRLKNGQPLLTTKGQSLVE